MFFLSYCYFSEDNWWILMKKSGVFKWLVSTSENNLMQIQIKLIYLCFIWHWIGFDWIKRESFALRSVTQPWNYNIRRKTKSCLFFGRRPQTLLALCRITGSTHQSTCDVSASESGSILSNCFGFKPTLMADFPQSDSTTAKRKLTLHLHLHPLWSI